MDDRRGVEWGGPQGSKVGWVATAGGAVKWTVGPRGKGARELLFLFGFLYSCTAHLHGSKLHLS